MDTPLIIKSFLVGIVIVFTFIFVSNREGFKAAWSNPNSCFPSQNGFCKTQLTTYSIPYDLNYPCPSGYKTLHPESPNLCWIDAKVAMNLCKTLNDCSGVYVYTNPQFPAEGLLMNRELAANTYNSYYQKK